MSWSVSGIGKAAAVRKAIAQQFANGGKCVEPEETIRQTAASLIDKALEGQSDAIAVRVIANGSQSMSSGVVNNNSCSISVEPLYGFVE